MGLNLIMTHVYKCPFGTKPPPPFSFKTLLLHRRHTKQTHAAHSTAAHIWPHHIHSCTHKNLMARSPWNTQSPPRWMVSVFWLIHLMPLHVRFGIFGLFCRLFSFPSIHRNSFMEFSVLRAQRNKSTCRNGHLAHSCHTQEPRKGETVPSQQNCTECLERTPHENPYNLLRTQLSSEHDIHLIFHTRCISRNEKKFFFSLSF